MAWPNGSDQDEPVKFVDAFHVYQEYGAELFAEIEAIENADTAVDEADVALALARS